MNINNKIEIHRGVYFPRPEASALSLNWKPGHTTYANEFTFINTKSSGTPSEYSVGAMEPLKLINDTNVVATADIPAIFSTIESGNLYITYQGAEEPYNKPDLTDGVAVAQLDRLMVPENLYVRLRDAAITFDATRLIADLMGGTAITAADIGKSLVVIQAATTPFAVTVATSAAPAAGDHIVGIITGVDTTSVTGSTLVTLVC